MSRRRVRFTVLAEDRQSQDFIVRGLRSRGVSRREIRTAPLPSRVSGGAGEQFVRTRYADQVLALRAAGRGALIVHIDADPTHTVAQRHQQLADALAMAGLAPRKAGDRIAELVPKRNIETWIHALDSSLRPDLERPLSEGEEYPKLSSASRCEHAARRFAALAAELAAPAHLPSISDGVSELRRVL